MTQDKRKNELDETYDPLAELGGQEEESSKSPLKKARKAKKAPSEKQNMFEKLRGNRKDKKAQEKVPFVRIEDADTEDEETARVVSMYLPRRRLRLLARAFLRLDKMRLLLLFALFIVVLLFILSFVQEKMGNFTINLDRLEMFRKGIAIDYDPNFSQPTARLLAEPVKDATNISIADLPDDIDDVDGGHNGRNYMAYTYYLRNAGKEDVDYVATISLQSVSKNADAAVRVALWHNGERTVYARPSADGSPEPGCVNFESDSIVCKLPEKDFRVGYVNKYTVAIWLEGDDPECVDAIVGGSVQFLMKISAYSDVETTLLQKYYQDILDTLRGTKPINPAGTTAPDFQKYEDVTWDTRRNR